MVAFKNAKQKDWLTACKRLGLVVDTTRGKGSHARVYAPNNPVIPPLTIQNSNLNPITNGKIYKHLKMMGFSEEEIDKALK